MKYTINYENDKIFANKKTGELARVNIPYGTIEERHEVTKEEQEKRKINGERQKKEYLESEGLEEISQKDLVDAMHSSDRDFINLYRMVREQENFSTMEEEIKRLGKEIVEFMCLDFIVRNNL